jgi:hypothetical protein
VVLEQAIKASQVAMGQLRQMSTQLLVAVVLEQ